MGVLVMRAGPGFAALAVIVLLDASGMSRAAEYVVDGFALGQPIAADDANYASYDCRPSADYDGAIRCTRVQQRKGQAGDLRISSTLIHADGGPTWFESVHAAPVKLSRAALEKEIGDLTRVIGAAPTLVDWRPGYTPDLTAVIAVWGEVELEQAYYPAPPDIGREGGFIDLIGDPATSLENYLPVYQVKGGAGYVYAANFNASGIGDRYYVAVNAAALAPAHYRTTLRALLARDAALGADDYSLWPDVAMATRTLSLATSSAAANQQFDRVVGEFPASKLRSHVWAMLPTGAIERLRQGSFWIDYDIYGPDTRHPVVRKDLQDLIASEPDDRFIEFAHLLLGDLQGGLRARPDSTITGVFHYALGIESFRALLHDALVSLRDRPPAALNEEDLAQLDRLTTGDPDFPDEKFSISGALSFATHYPGLAPGELSKGLPDFAARAEAVKAHFAAVTDAMSVVDDTAFIGAWLDLETGDLQGALAFAAKGLAIGRAHADIAGTGRNQDWLDYEGAIHAKAKQIVAQLPRADLVRTLQADEILSRESFLWYSTARDAYRAFDYDYVIELAEAGLGSLGVPSEQLPATTDPNRIRAAIERIDPLLIDLDIVELPYLLEASREFLSYEAELARAADAADPTVLATQARQLISKYSMLISRPEASEPDADVSARHQDLRQALHLIDITQERTAHNPAYAQLREWLAFRKVRVLTSYDPERVRSAVAQLAAESPASQYLDDALAEQVFVEGMLRRDIEAAWSALDELVRQAPEGSNAIDNGFSWMAISLRCEGLDADAEDINLEILWRFPASRHAQYAWLRAADPDRSNRGCDGGYLD
jgi:hypothetical protein